jgi:dihydroceramidase
MHIATGLVTHQVFCFGQSKDKQRKVTFVLLGILIPFFIYHCVADEFFMHTVVFGGMVVIVARKTRYVIRDRLQNPADRYRLKTLATFGSSKFKAKVFLAPANVLLISLGCAFIAWILWNIDVHLCDQLTAFKRYIGMPWGIYFELHGWWHVLTAVAAYTFMALVEFLTDVELGTSAEEFPGFLWPAKIFLKTPVHEHSH